MKLSNKILIASFIVVLLLTLITMFKVRSIHKDFLSNQTEGNKNWVTVEYPMQEFTELKAGNHFEVKWHKGNPLVKVRIEENIKPYFRAIQKNNQVEIKFDSLTSYRLNGTIVVDVYSKTLDHLILEDFVEFATLDTIASEQMQIQMEDHCDADVMMHSTHLDLHLNDFCDLNLSGFTDDATIKIRDHSKLEAEKLNILNASVDMEDFTEADINVKRHLKAECVDHSALNYLGDSVITEIIQRDFSEVSKSKSE